MKGFFSSLFSRLKIIYSNLVKQIALVSWHSAAKEFFFFLQVQVAGSSLHHLGGSGQRGWSLVRLLGRNCLPPLGTGGSVCSTTWWLTALKCIIVITFLSSCRPKEWAAAQNRVRQLCNTAHTSGPYTLAHTCTRPGVLPNLTTTNLDICKYTMK